MSAMTEVDLRGTRPAVRMADELSEGEPQEALNCEISVEESRKRGLEFASAEHLSCTPGEFGERQYSQREYKKLFFDCNLHLVLPKLLEHSLSSGTNAAAELPFSAPFETHGTRKPDFTDAEVARLLRKHLPILLASQTVPDSEVIAAAKVLQQRHRTSVEPSALEQETENQGTAKVRNSETGETGGSSISPVSCGVGDSTVSALEDTKYCVLGGFCMEESQASDEWVTEKGSGRSRAGSDVPARGAEETVAGLVFPQRRGAPEFGASQHAVVAMASASKNIISRHDFSASKAVEGPGQPAKRVCIPMRDTG